MISNHIKNRVKDFIKDKKSLVKVLNASTNVEDKPKKNTKDVTVGKTDKTKKNK